MTRLLLIVLASACLALAVFVWMGREDAGGLLPDAKADLWSSPSPTGV